jgi:hypothetical protein
VEGVLYAHDKIAERERLLMTNDSPLNAGESVDEPLGVGVGVGVVGLVPVVPILPQQPPPPPSSSVIISPPKPLVRPAFVPEPTATADDRIKVVRIEKTQDPLVSPKMCYLAKLNYILLRCQEFDTGFMIVLRVNE